MQEAFININNIPTKVLTYGRWITEKPEKKEEKIILVITGNPGSTGFYKKFMKILYEKHNCPVWVIGHSGHESYSQKSINIPFPKPIGLKEQVKLKAAFIEQYVPEDTNLHVIAHSIGSYMTLELLKETHIEKRITCTYLLFPTIEKMIETPNGKFLYNYVRFIVWLVIALSSLFRVLPKSISMNLLKIYMLMKNMPAENQDTIFNLIHPKVLEQVFSLAYEELDQVKERDNDNIRKNSNRICILYGQSDGWCLGHFYDDIKKDFPNVKVRISDYDHTFVFHQNEEVAEIVEKWICDRQS